jgi:hypothetical protein
MILFTAKGPNIQGMLTWPTVQTKEKVMASFAALGQR